MDPIILVAVGFIFIVIGLILGFVIGSMHGRNRQMQSPPEAAPEAASPPSLPPTPSHFAPKDSVELLSVWRNERTHKLLALLDSKPLSPSQLTDEQKDRLHNILAGLHTLTGDLTPPVSPEAQPVQPLVQEAPSKPAQTGDSTPAFPDPQSSEAALLDEASSGPAKKVYFADTLPEPVTLRQALVSNPFKISVPSSKQKPPSAPKSIVEQIDEILQTKLANSPYGNQEIKLEEIPDGMAVLVGSLRFEGIDAVPDPTIRALIKESAREWNEKVSRKR